MLAGGFGTRLRPLTFHRPKPLMPLLGRPMLEHMVAQMPPSVERVVFAVNYMADAIRDHLSRVDLGVEVVVVEEEEPLGTGGAFRNALGSLDSEEFIGMNGDVVSSLDMAGLVEHHRRAGGVGTIALWPVEDPSAFGVVELDGEGRVLSFQEKPPREEARSDLINAGVYVLDTGILDLVEPDTFTSLEREVFPRVLDRGLYGHTFSGYWIDAGTPGAYLQANWHLLDNVRPLPGGDADVHPTAEVRGPCVLGDGVTVGPDARVGPYAVLGDGCAVGARALVERSVLMAGVEVGAEARLRDAIMGEGSRASPGSSVEIDVVEDGKEAL